MLAQFVTFKSAVGSPPVSPPQNMGNGDKTRGGNKGQQCDGTREQTRKHPISLRRTLRACSCKRRHAGGAQADGLESLVVRDEERATPWLPEFLHARLATRLEHELFGKTGVRVGVEEDLDQYESAFEFAPAPDRYIYHSHDACVWKLCFVYR